MSFPTYTFPGYPTPSWGAWLTEEIWTYATRTLTTPVAGVTEPSGSDVALYLYARNAVTWTDLELADRTGLYVTVKANRDLADSAAMVQVEETAGLLYLAGAAAADPLLASLTVDGTTLTMVVEDDAAALLTAGVYGYDVKKLTADGAAVPVAWGKCTIARVVTRALE